MMLAESLIYFAGMRSGPVALLDCNLEMILRTLSVVMF